MRTFAIVFVVALTAGAAKAGTAQLTPTRSATDLAFDMYNSCLKDFSTSCVQPKAMQWFNQALQQDEIQITDKLSIVRTSRVEPIQQRSYDPQEQMFNDIDNFLATHALRVRAPEFFSTEEARSYVPDFLFSNALTKDSVVPLAERDPNQGRGMVRKVLLPFLIGLKLKTTVLVPLALALIALKTWKAMTLGLLSLVLSGALVVFKIAKPKIINYEVVHYPHHVEHVEHIEHIPHHVDHFPHHVDHIVPHHIDIVPHHVDHHVDHHIDLPPHVEHVEHFEHPSPAWDPHAWARSSQEPQDAQDMAFSGQRQT
ncbi:uncharacterized protein LOC118738398 [Rhagoletis pomonella]|uniref:uncharacterized protein LOC118738398 n=1 Tax=Rhagoletis pomonella TaxID=28610 RepID=UPI00177C703B|nr:uncharacterized protein LOC118738398 [Rhagoletis pomonella]